MHDPFPVIRIRTVEMLENGEEGYLYPGYIIYDDRTKKHFVHPRCPVYDTLPLGSRIKKQTSRLVLRVAHGCQTKTWESPISPEDDGYIAVGKCVYERRY